MKRSTLRSPHDWLIVGLVAMAAFSYSSVGAIVLARLADGAFAQTKGMMVTRLLVSFVVAVGMLVAERRRERPSMDAAAIEGFKVAAVVIIAYNLAGGADSGLPLSLRTVFMLIGLPLLAVFTHALARRGRSAAAQEAL